MAPDWVGCRVRIIHGRLSGRIGTAIQYAHGKFSIVLPGPQTVVKHAADAALLPCAALRDDAMVGRRVTILSGSFRGATGVVRGRARGGFYLVAMTDNCGDVIMILKKSQDVKASRSLLDRTMNSSFNFNEFNGSTYTTSSI